MRIAIDARITYYARGGIRNYVLRLLDRLAQVDPESDYYILHSRKDPKPPHPAINFHLVPCWTPAHHSLERWMLGLEIARLRLDLLHSPDFIPPAFGARRSVITVHDLTFLHYPQFLTADSHRYYNGQIDWAVQRSDAILADSRTTRDDLITLLDVPPEKISVVHLAADERYHPVNEVEARIILKRYNLEPGYLLFVGTLEPRKNIPGLLRAYRYLLDKRGNAPPLILIGGKGWLYHDVFESVSSLSLTDCVRFLHHVSDDDLPALYSSASQLILPSFYEGFGLPALEAMACGTPVIAANRASLPEVVGQAGVLVDPEDPVAIANAMARILADEDLRHGMRLRGFARSAGFTWNRVAHETRAIYQRFSEQ